MDQIVCQHQVCNGVNVHLKPKILVVVSTKTGAYAVVVVHHACHSIKTESVNLVLFNEPRKVAQQESYHFILTHIEDHRVPGAVVPLGPSMRVTVVCAIKSIYPVRDIIRGMGVDNIDYYSETQTVCFVHQILKLIGGSLARRGREIVGNMVAKRAIVCVFLNGHDLDTVVASGLDPGEHIVCKINI